MILATFSVLFFLYSFDAGSKIISNKICTFISYPLHSYLLFGCCVAHRDSHIYVVTNRMESRLSFASLYRMQFCSVHIYNIHIYIYIFNACCVYCFYFLRFYALDSILLLCHERVCLAYWEQHKQLHIIYVCGGFLCAFRDTIHRCCVCHAIRHWPFVREKQLVSQRGTRAR